MPRLRVDGHDVEVAPGTTLLAAAATVGADIPTLCWRRGYECSTSCMVCAVKVSGRARLLPACATPAEDGMDVVTNDTEVRQFRREVLELLLSDHSGDCEGPCRLGCPAHLDIPGLLRAVQRGEWATAASLARETLVLPETLGLVCPAPCEKACRRAHHDAAVAIRDLHRTVAWRERHADLTRILPEMDGADRPVVIVGAGPTGLAAAATLARRGRRCVLLDDQPEPGGKLRQAIAEPRLPAAVLAADADAIAALGVEFRLGTRLDTAAALAALLADAAAVVLAMGAGSTVADLGLTMSDTGVHVDRGTSMTSMPGVFAAGGVVREIRRMAVRAVAAGSAAAAHVDAWLRQAASPVRHAPVHVRLGHLREGELALFLADANPAPRTPSPGHTALSDEDARSAAARCLHCDCRAAQTCGLRRLAAEYDAAPHRWHDTRRTVVMERSHADVIYEPGKCIACGLCTQAAERAGEPLGSTFLWRGISVRVGPPLGETMAAALTTSATACVAACPTGALAWKRD